MDAMNDEIEISYDVQVSANIAFWVSRDAWGTMTDEQKRLEIVNRGERAAMNFANDVVRLDDVNIAISIHGPCEEADIDLSLARVYDPHPAPTAEEVLREVWEQAYKNSGSDGDVGLPDGAWSLVKEYGARHFKREG